MKRLLFYFLVIFILSFALGTKAQTTMSLPQSLSISATVVAPIVPPPGGGSGGVGYVVPTSVVFSGQAASFSKVYLLKDGQFFSVATVGPDSKFSLTINNGLNNGNYLFSLYGEDSYLRRSKLFNLSLHLVSNTTTIVSGIILLPNPELSNFPGAGIECLLVADFNNDCKVNLIDFSILKYWYQKNNPPSGVDLNKDKKIDIVDFSIMAYYWTG
jgi:hypothetical protein